MSIEDFKEKIKYFADDFKIISDESQKVFKISDGLFIVIILLLVAIGAFGLGKISAYEKREVPISVIKNEERVLTNVSEQKLATIASSNQKTDESPKDMIVASKNGKKYYYTWCSGADRIKEENKIWFATVEEAKSRGLEPSSGCTGLK